MASLTVRNIPEEAKRRFRQVAAAHGRSMEEHLRQLILAAEVAAPRGLAETAVPFRHAEPAEEFVSTGSDNIDRLIRLGRGIEFEAPAREVEEFRLPDFS